MSRLIFDADTLGGTTTLSSADAVGNFTLIVPAVDGTLSVKDSSGDATFRNLTLTGAVLAGAWNGTRIGVAYGGTGAITLTGYVKGNGTSAMTASSTIPNTDITGLGTMSTQGSDAVTITGGTANGLTIGAVNPAAATVTTLRVNSTLSLAGTTGTSGQVLASNGASAPTWQNLAGTGTVTSIDVSGGTTGLTTSGGPVTSTGTITLAGTLAIANGGTGATTAAAARTALGLGTIATQAASAVAITGGSINGTSLGATTAGSAKVTTLDVASGLTLATLAGTSGQVLTSAGAGFVPTWATPTTGTVTSVSFTGGVVSVATATTTPALTIAGTSGGVPYFSSASTWATSAALAANALMIGGGAGTAPSTITTGTGVVTALGVNVGSAGAFVTFNGALGTPSSGTVTNLTGTASININGTVGATTANTGAFTTISATGVITSTLATGTAPFTVASTTNVANLNASSLSGATFASPGAIGSTAAGTGAFTTLAASSTVSGTGFTTYFASPPALGTTAPAEVKVTVGWAANTALTDAATVAWDTTNQVATFTFVSSNRTMGAPTNLKNGAFYALAVIQNSGSNTLTWNSVFKWAAGTAPTLSTAASAKDYFTFRSDGTNLYQQGISQAVA